MDDWELGDMDEDVAAYLGLDAFAPPRPASQPAQPVHGPGTDQLAKVYVEATSRCNLSCRTCVRNAWAEPQGLMSLEVFQRVVEGLQGMAGPLTMVFAGYGEPLVHPDILPMLRMAKEVGVRVEVITNGTLLGGACAQALIDLGLDRVWFSIDGLTPEGYAAVRRGGQLATVRQNITGLYHARVRDGRSAPEIGLVFVAMRSNIRELPGLYRLAVSVRAAEVLVSNLLPHTDDMIGEILYRTTLSTGQFTAAPDVPRVRLPRIDTDQVTSLPLLEVMRAALNVEVAGANAAEQSNVCPFVQAGATAIRWDGQVSPCPPLLHGHPVFVPNRWRNLRQATFGDVREQTLPEIWNSAEYSAFRSRVREFSFSPCVFCDGCYMAESNDEDCLGNSFPVCGSCLWAQGIVRCP